MTLEGRVNESTLRKLKNGVELEYDFSDRSKAGLIKQTGSRSIIRLTVKQGRNRRVRRMVEVVGCKVIQLMRTGFGGLEIGNLKIGKYRYLTVEEVADLKCSVGLSQYLSEKTVLESVS